VGDAGAVREDSIAGLEPRQDARMDLSKSMNQLLAIAAIDRAAIPQRPRRLAELSLFDWMSVGRAGSEQPVSDIIRAFVEEEGGKPAATVIGSGKLLPARAAALANGTISHCLDYDDTHFAHIGHLSVAIYPAALAAAESVGAGAGDVRDAFLLGAEAACRIGMVLGRIHYQRGFHQTATSGAFGATLAAGRIFGLDAVQMRHALSLVSTRASGLKSQFGTMGKPFNAGIAAANGVEAAALAKRGFVSCDDGIGGPQGFIETHSDAADPEGPWKEPPPGKFIFEGIKYKLHACCHGAHAMIEALRNIRRRRAIAPGEIAAIKVVTHPRWLRVCDLKAPRTGLEAKFSYALLAAMVMRGFDTTAEKTFIDALCQDSDLRGLAERVEVAGDAALSDTQCRVDVALAGGAHVECAHDLADLQPEAVIEKGLRNKARGLLGEALAGRMWSGISVLDRLSARDLARLLTG
jgi:2-methylcitrate dehydratase PrpD